MIFWILAAGLIGLALLFIILPLFSEEAPREAPEPDALNLEVFRERLRELDVDLSAGFLDQDQYAAAKRDLERDLLHDLDGNATATSESAPSSAISRWLLATVLAISVPALAVFMYLELGDQGIIQRLETTGGQPANAPANQEAASMEVLVQRLEERLQAEPDNIDGWLMLGRTALATDQVEKGLKAIEKAYALAPERVDVMLSYAQALAATSPTKRLAGQPTELIRAALAQEPENQVARWLGGMIDYQNGQIEAAITVWQTILGEMDPASDEAKNLRQMIAEAKAQPAQPAAVAEPAPAPATDAPATTEATAEQPAAVTTTDAAVESSITVAVSLDPAMAAQVAPDNAVFVFARAANGPPMPLAVKRLQVSDLPQTVTLDDSMAMSPGMRLSDFPDVVLGARVSKSGEAMPQSGDLEGLTDVVKRGTDTEVSVTINRIRP